MVFLEMIKNLWFCPIFPIRNLIQESIVGASSLQFASLASLNLGSKSVVSNPNSTSKIALEMAKKDEQRKKHKLYEGLKKFLDTWTTKLPWVDLCLMKRVRCNKSSVKFAPLLKGNKSFRLPSLIVCWNTKVIKKPKSWCLVLMQDHFTSTKLPYMLRMNVFTLLDEYPSMLD